MAGLYAETAEFKDPSFGQDVVKQTRKQIAEKYNRLGEMFPDVKDSVIAYILQGKKMYCRTYFLRNSP